MIYLDTCAFVKLLWQEQESAALQRFLASSAEQRLVSSELLVLEVRRAVLRAGAVMSRAELLLTRIDRVGITRAVVEAASRLPEPHLRSLDAIHLATALTLRTELGAFVTYDKRLISAAEVYRIPVTSPVD